MKFVGPEGETNTTLGGPVSGLEKYQQSLILDTVYGFCVEPYTVNNRTRWRLEQKLKIISLKGK